MYEMVLRNEGSCRTVQCMVLRTTSFRLNDDESELLSAWAAYLKATNPHLIKGTHSDALRHLMKRSRPPDRPGPVEARLRAAYITLFGEIPT